VSVPFVCVDKMHTVFLLKTVFRPFYFITHVLSFEATLVHLCVVSVFCFLYDMSHVFVIYMTCLCHLYAMSHLCDMTILCDTTHSCEMTHSYGMIHLCDMTHLYDMSHLCDMTHVSVSFEPTLVHVFVFSVFHSRRRSGCILTTPVTYDYNRISDRRLYYNRMCTANLYQLPWRYWEF